MSRDKSDQAMNCFSTSRNVRDRDFLYVIEIEGEYSNDNMSYISGVSH